MLYNFFEFPVEVLFYGKWRNQLFSYLDSNKFLEVGVGTGKNFKYHPSKQTAIGIDLSEGMLSKAKSNSESKTKFLIQSDVQRLPFNDSSFEQVVATFVFCSVPNPIVGLKEINRILKPGGKLYLLEHVLPENKLFARLFNILNFVTVKQGGVFINRRTVNNVTAAGFKIEKELNLLSTIFKLIVAKPV